MSIKNLTQSSIGKKLITGVTGLALVGFLIAHLLGNLTLFFGPGAFNAYAYKLHSLGPILYLAELILLLFFVFHAVTGIRIWLGKKKSRPVGYAVSGNAGGKSKKSLASRSMIVSGLTLLVFTIVHLIQFKFGGDMSDGYIYDLNGKDVRDLYTLVVESFEGFFFTAFYVICMVILGLHLKHGVWSAFQSLGVSRPDWIRPMHLGGMIFGILLAVGFIILPIFFFIKGLGN